MFGSVQRHVNPRHLPHFAPPQPAAVDHVFCIDLAPVGDHANHAPVLFLDTGYFGVLEDAHPTHAGAFCQGHGHVDGIGAAVLRGVEPGQQIAGVEQRPHAMYFRG